MYENVIYKKAPVHHLVLVTDLIIEALLITNLCLKTIDKGRGRKSVESLDALSHNLILGSEVLNIPNHMVNLIL